VNCGHEDEVVVVVSVDVIKVVVERFINGSPALRHAVEDKCRNASCMAGSKRSIRMSDPAALIL
jgi:hypothetical protein